MQAPPLARDLVSTMNNAAPRIAMEDISVTKTASNSGSVKTYGAEDGPPQAGVNY